MSLAKGRRDWQHDVHRCCRQGREPGAPPAARCSPRSLPCTAPGSALTVRGSVAVSVRAKRRGRTDLGRAVDGRHVEENEVARAVAVQPLHLAEVAVEQLRVQSARGGQRPREERGGVGEGAYAAWSMEVL